MSDTDIHGMGGLGPPPAPRQPRPIASPLPWGAVGYLGLAAPAVPKADTEFELGRLTTRRGSAIGRCSASYVHTRAKSHVGHIPQSPTFRQSSSTLLKHTSVSSTLMLRRCETGHDKRSSPNCKNSAGD